MDLASLAGLEGDGDKGIRDLEEGDVSRAV